MDTIEKAVSKLEAIAAVRPDAKPIVDAAVAAVKAAQEEIERAQAETEKAVERAEAAEQVVEGIKPHMRQIDRRAERLQRELAKSEEEKAALALQMKRTVEKRRERAQEADEDDAVAKSGALKSAIELAVGCCKLTKSVHDGRHMIDNRREGAFEVFNFEGELVDVCETRKDAVALVTKLVAARKAEVARTRDLIDAPLEDQREPQPGEQPHDGGRLDGVRVGKQRVVKRGPKIF